MLVGLLPVGNRGTTNEKHREVRPPAGATGGAEAATPRLFSASGPITRRLPFFALSREINFADFFTADARWSLRRELQEKDSPVCP